MQKIGNKDDVRPVKKGQFSMFLSDKWYRCTMRPESVPEDPVEGLVYRYYRMYFWHRYLESVIQRQIKELILSAEYAA